MAAKTQGRLEGSVAIKEVLRRLPRLFPYSAGDGVCDVRCQCRALAQADDAQQRAALGLLRRRGSVGCGGLGLRHDPLPNDAGDDGAVANIGAWEREGPVSMASEGEGVWRSGGGEERVRVRVRRRRGRDNVRFSIV